MLHIIEDLSLSLRHRNEKVYNHKFLNYDKKDYVLCRYGTDGIDGM